MRPLLLATLTLCIITHGACAPTATPVQRGSIDIHFCQQENCTAAIIQAVTASQEVQCAFYDLDLPVLEKALRKASATVLVFDENHEGFGTPVPALHGGLMHNKFCILDAGTPRARIVTGSTNPTRNGMERNDNHLVFIEGEHLVKNYQEEFEELAGGRERTVAHPHVIHTTRGRNLLIENYFCPEDNCEEEVLSELAHAEEEILFTTFSFTSDAIGALLIERHEEGVEVEGIFENRQRSRYTEYDKLKQAGVAVQRDANPQTMHHKVFLIDPGSPRATVITGSYNPTKSGDTRNDENLLIIHDTAVTNQFLQEFRRIAAEAERT